MQVKLEWIAMGGLTGVIGAVQFFRMNRRLGNLGTGAEDEQREATAAPDRGE